MLHSRLLTIVVMPVTMVAGSLVAQDTTERKDTVQATTQAPAPPAPPAPTNPVPLTIEQIRYQEGLRTTTRGITQLRDGLGRVSRTQLADSLTRRRAARRLGGLCGSARTFIASGRTKMQPTAYADTLRILAKQVTTRLDTLARALPDCEKLAGRDPATVTNSLTTRLKAYDDAVLAFKNALAAATKPDSTKSVSQQ
jgi:hypothetical protein